MEKKNIGSLSTNLIDIFEDKTDKVLILGIGNYLMGDEGVGVHIIHQMEKMILPEYVEVLDGGTGGFFLMNVFDDYGKVIFLDATMDGKNAGTIKVLHPKFASDFPKALSVHDVGLKDMVEALYLQDILPEMHLITISVIGIQPMIVGMTDPVEKCVPEAIETILNLAEKIHTKIK
ncbi:MAG: hydrogenase maturation protease [Bacteroidetes bacterium]|nr:MAG: hydrogenase maturation protease [Bacteroidota bacterium]